MKTTEELANAAFEAKERVRMLEMMNSSDDYATRKKQHAELCLAIEAHQIADRALRSRIYAPPPQAPSPIEERSDTDGAAE